MLVVKNIRVDRQWLVSVSFYASNLTAGADIGNYVVKVLMLNKKCKEEYDS